MTIVVDRESHSWEVGYDKGYQQGRADANREIQWKVADFNLQLKKAEMRGRQDALSEVMVEVINHIGYWVLNDDNAPANVVAFESYNHLKADVVEILEKLKEQTE